MTKKTRAIHWGRLVGASLLTLCGVAGCGEAPTAPSQSERYPAPTILSVTPSIGSPGGGAFVTITGAGFRTGAWVAFGVTNAMVLGYDSPDRIYVTAPSHLPGSVDVVVSNGYGQNAVAIGAFTFAASESFDVNGHWRGASFVGDYNEPFRFTVVDGAVVDITCSTSGLVRLSPPAPIIHGDFSFSGEDGVTVSGRIVAPNQAKGDVNIDPGGTVSPCVGGEWEARREQSE